MAINPFKPGTQTQIGQVLERKEQSWSKGVR